VKSRRRVLKNSKVNDCNAGVLAEQMPKRVVSSVKLNAAAMPPSALLIYVGVARFEEAFCLVWSRVNRGTR
jgi:hypothetical protein